jgi:hypothetical protein
MYVYIHIINYLITTGNPQAPEAASRQKGAQFTCCTSTRVQILTRRIPIKKAMNDLKQLKRLEKHPQLHLGVNYSSKAVR